MKILVYLEKSDVRGGIEVFAERHVARLRAEGHEVDVLSYPFPVPHSHPSSDRLRGSLRSGDTFPIPRSPFPDYDEIIVHKCSDVATLEKFPPEKTVYYVHDHEPICPRGYAYTPLKRNCTRAGGVWPCLFCAPACRSWKAALGRVFSQKRRIAAMSRFKKIVVISEFMKSRLVANKIPAEKIVVEPPKIASDRVGLGSLRVGLGSDRVADPTQTLHDPTQTLHDPTQTLIDPNPTLSDSNRAPVDLLYVGQLIRGKGVHLLLEAMAKMKSPRTLDIVGTGNMEGELKSLAAQLGLSDRVHFNGFQDSPQEWMRRAACVVVPSFWQEPYGLVAAEAVALGRPVVAFAIGGLPEACQGKATLVPPGDIDALAKVLEKEQLDE